MSSAIVGIRAKDFAALQLPTTTRKVCIENNIKLLQQVREDANWEPWILYILKGVEETAKQTLHLIEGIKNLMWEYKNRIRSTLPKIYSQDLLNNIFKHPYTKIEFLEKDLTVKRKTAAKYLNQLVEAGLLQKVNIGTTNF